MSVRAPHACTDHGMEWGVRSLGLELQIIVSYPVESNLGPLEKQPVLLTSEPSPQPFLRLVYDNRKL